MNSFIIARRQRKLRTFSENPLSGSWVPPLGSQIAGPGYIYELSPGSQVSFPIFMIAGPTYEMGPASLVLGPTKSPGSQVPLFGYAA